MNEEKIRWSIPVNGVINVPDYLDPLVNSIAFQHKLHTISKLFGEDEMYCRMAEAAEVFFKKHYENK